MTLRALRKIRSHAQIPVVVLSLLSPGDRQPEARPADSWLRRLSRRRCFWPSWLVCSRISEHPTVLLVEDDETSLASFSPPSSETVSLSTMLPGCSHAIELCESVRPDLIILDLALPDGHGLELVDWLRTRKELRRLPLVVYSAREVSSSERGLFQFGPTEFLTKT